MPEEIQRIEVKNLKVGRKQSLVINNFYSLITIAIMSVVIIWYVNYVLPEQNKQKENEVKMLNKMKHIESLKSKREDQIRLSQKLNKKTNEKEKNAK